MIVPSSFVLFFFFTDPATTEIYTLSLHDALPIWSPGCGPSSTSSGSWATPASCPTSKRRGSKPDRKSTRLNSSHRCISYAVFCLKKKKKTKKKLKHPNHQQKQLKSLL